MGLLNDLETRLEQEVPQRLQESLQRALDDYRAQCAPCGLMMHRHHRHPRPSSPDMDRSGCGYRYFAVAGAGR